MHSALPRLLISAALLAGAAAASGEELPSFAQLEAAGALIGEIRITPLDIFDVTDPRESNALFRAANLLHFRTRPYAIERELLFKRGDPVSVRVIEETERILRSRRHLYSVLIRPVAYRDGVADVEVQTRDTWSFDPGFAFSRAGGANSSRLAIREHNLFGAGIAVGVSYASTPDRRGGEFSLSDNHAFGGWAAFNMGVALDERGGRSQFASLVRPFHSLDARSSGGLSGSRTDRIDTVYDRGVEIAQYRTRINTAEAFHGWSNGLVDGWTRRWSLGIGHQDEAYEVVEGEPAPGQLPGNVTLTGPFLRYEIIQDDYRKLANRDSVHTVEYFPLGFHARVQLGRAMSAFGSTRDLWQYSGTISDGFVPGGEQILLLSATFSGRYASGNAEFEQGERQLFGGAVRYYRPQRNSGLFYASLSGDMVKHADASTVLQLGGDTGLRGYPLRYQSGDRRLLLSLEERVYTDWYPLRLFRVGGAVFYDFGRAWAGASQVPASEHWLSDVGFGARFVSARSAFGNVLHLDVAFPLNERNEVRSVQFLVKTKATF